VNAAEKRRLILLVKAKQGEARTLLKEVKIGSGWPQMAHDHKWPMITNHTLHDPLTSRSDFLHTFTHTLTWLKSKVNVYTPSSPLNPKNYPSSLNIPKSTPSIPKSRPQKPQNHISQPQKLYPTHSHPLSHPSHPLHPSTTPNNTQQSPTIPL